MERLVELRKSKNLTQKQLADILCTTQSYISRIECDKCEASPFLLNDIAKFFQVTIGYIIGAEDENVEKSINDEVFEGINEYEIILEKYKTLNDEHKAIIKLNLDFFFELDNGGKTVK